MAAALHVDLSVPNFGMQEYMPHTPETDAVFPHGYPSPTATCTRATSRASASTSTRTAAAGYPYGPRYLPVNRRRDGSMHDW